MILICPRIVSRKQSNCDYPTATAWCSIGIDICHAKFHRKEKSHNYFLIGTLVDFKEIEQIG